MELHSGRLLYFVGHDASILDVMLGGRIAPERQGAFDWREWLCPMSMLTTLTDRVRGRNLHCDERLFWPSSQPNQ